MKKPTSSRGKNGERPQQSYPSGPTDHEHVLIFINNNMYEISLFNAYSRSVSTIYPVFFCCSQRKQETPLLLFVSAFIDGYDIHKKRSTLGIQFQLLNQHSTDRASKNNAWVWGFISKCHQKDLANTSDQVFDIQPYLTLLLNDLVRANTAGRFICFSTKHILSFLA
jgi:hypothetical protein